MRNWLTRDQAKELFRVPDRRTLKGKRDCAVLALLVGCALHRRELSALDTADIQHRKERWVIADLRGKGEPFLDGSYTPLGEDGIDLWLEEAELKEGRIFRAIGKVAGSRAPV